MKYTIEAKPTLYNGIYFRSKLEAQWAAFFDLVNITWEYEPERFKEWEPDFLIQGVKPIYVEVKPFIDDSIIHSYIKKCEKIIKAGNISEPIINTDFLGKEYTCYDVDSDYKVIIVSSPIGHPKDQLSEGYEEVPFGVTFDFYGKEIQYSSLYWKDNFDFSSQILIWDGLLGTSKERKFFGYSNVKSAWKKAKNIIQTIIQ